MTAEAALLVVDDLRVEFRTRRGRALVLGGVEFELRGGETLCVVGESGCGKSMTALAILGLVPSPPGRVTGGRIVFQGEDLVQASDARLRDVRGNRISMIFQEPMTSLNPVFSVGEQIAESLRLHEGLGRKAAMDRAVEMLALVRIPTPERRVRDYPHQFSGGMRQRVMIAIALACNPQLLIADEPTTALDVTIQAQILDLLGELRERLGMAVMLITHAMGVVAEVAERVVVMYAGKVVEEAAVADLFARPRHPYTQGLIRSIPRIDTAALHKVRLEQIPGTVPKLIDPPPGCRFAARCRYAVPECTKATPPLREPVPGHKVACIFDEFPALAAVAA